MLTLQNVLKFNRRPILISFFCVVLYYFFAYDLTRVEYQKLVLLYSALFIGFILLIRHKALNFKFLVGIAILFRLIFLLAIPNLSQDFYRFIWDGQLMARGINPLAELPSYYIEQSVMDPALYNQLNSKQYFTIYPPGTQNCPH